MNTITTLYTPAYKYFAAAYDCNTYGAEAYNVGGECTTATEQTQPTTNTGILSETGANTFIFIGLAALLVIAGAAIVIRAFILKKRRLAQR